MAYLFLLAFLIVPLGAIFVQAFAQGAAGYWRAVSDPIARSAFALTALTAAIVLPLNTAFGIAAAWAIARFQFPGRAILTTLIDLPFAVSPVISGLVFVLLFGAQGLFGPWLAAHGIKIIFALPGIVLATLFVTFPFVARELIPVMEGARARRGRGGRGARRERLADVPARDAAEYPLGAAVRRHSAARRARSASSARSRSSRGTSAARRTPRRSTSRFSTTSTSIRPRSPSPRCWRCWRW